MLLNETGIKIEIKKWTRSAPAEEHLLNHIMFILKNKRNSDFEGGRW